MHMLIESPRISPADRAAWDRLERYDRALGASAALERDADKAREVIVRFAAAGPCYASTSWGKDSTVVAHLLATSGVRVPLVWVRVEPWENPDCHMARDAFLARHGHLVDYVEITHRSTAPRWWDEDAWAHTSARTSGGGFAVAARRYGARHISGVRAEESKVRGMAMAQWGTEGPGSCRPIGWWKFHDVFAYLAAHDLPVHPAYAQSRGGVMDRKWLRVSSLGGVRGSGHGRQEWEQHYYGREIAALREAGRD
jgi:phosphoadenosine phosphosulfate reductase